jgi:methyl-accepting chemotaxis protein PixJ
VQTVTEEAVQAGEAVAQFSQTIVEAAQTTAQVMRDIAGLATKTAELTQLSQQRSDQIDVLSTQLFETVQFFQLPSAQENPTEPDRLTEAAPIKERSPDPALPA